MAPPAGFNSTMQLPKRQLSKIIVLVEFVIYLWWPTNSVGLPQQLRIDSQILSKPPCVPVYTHGGFSYRTQTARKAPLFPPPSTSSWWVQ